MKSSEIYRKAAEYLQDIPEECQLIGACYSLFRVSPNRRVADALCNRMKRAFACPENKGMAWWLCIIGDNRRTVKRGRILALCFMAAISESEGD
jgi:hypothetical protein